MEEFFLTHSVWQAMDLFDLDDYFPEGTSGLSQVRCPSLVMGASTDLLFPVWQQRELADKLRKEGTQDSYHWHILLALQW